MSERDSDSVPGCEARLPLVPVGCGGPGAVVVALEDPEDPDEEDEDTGGGGTGDKRGPEERDSARESRDSRDTLDVSELFSKVSHSFLGDNKPERGRERLVETCVCEFYCKRRLKIVRRV